MDICKVCRRPIAPDDLVLVVVLTSRQTHWSPAEYDEVPMHTGCVDAGEQEPDPDRDRD